MDYTKLTKEELIKQLTDLQHAAAAVRAKDKEISEIKHELKTLQDNKDNIENQKLVEAIETNKELVDENRELVADLRYLIQVFNVFLNNFQNNSGLVQVLLKKYLNGGQ
jgi:nitrate reductase NapAB chaperone NapD